MKKKLLFLFTLCIILQGANAQYKLKRMPAETKFSTVSTRANLPGEHILAGFCSLKLQGYEMMGLGTGQPATLGGAIYLSKDVLKGGKIYGLRVAIMEPDTEFNLFISEKIGETPIYTQKATTAENPGWNYVVFETPVDITVDNFYIGYTIKSTDGYPLILEDGEKNTDADWVTLDGVKWENLSSGSPFKGAFAIQAIVTDGDFSSFPQNDAMLVSIDSENNKMGTIYVKSGTTADFSITVANYGVKPLKSFDLVYKIGGSSRTKSFTNLSISNGLSETFEITEVPFNSNEKVDLEISIDKPNNLADEIAADNQATVPVECYTNSFDRKLFIEQYTGQSCGYCPEGEKSLKASIAGIEDKVTWVAHHTYGKDAFTISQSTTYANFFGTQGAAPMCAINRIANEYCQANAVVFHPGYTTREMMDAYLSIPSFASVVLEGEFDNESKELSITVSGEFLKDLPKAKLNVFVIEDGFIANQSGGGNKYEHNRAMRAVLSALYGDQVELDANNKFSKTYTYVVPEKIASFKCNPYNMSVVAFIGDYTSGKNQECEVHNSEKLALKDLGAESSIDNISTSNLGVYTEGNMVYVNGEYSEATVYSANGELVKVINENSFSLDNGLYIIKLINGEQSLVKKILVNN